MMSAYRSSKTTTFFRMIAALVAAALLVSACGSTDDGREVVSRAEGTPTADNADGQANDGDETTSPTPPVAKPSETPTATPATPKPATPAPTVTPTVEPPRATPAPAPTKPAVIPIESPDLVGQDWYVRAVDSARGDVLPRPAGAVARIRFNADGTITGNAACNSFTARYTVKGSDLSITNFAITEMNCFIPDWSAFVEFLPRTTGYGSAGGPDPILFVGRDGSISLGSTPPDPNQAPATSPIADYIGLSEIEAAQLADSNGVAFRVSSIDGEAQALTMDFIEDRVNVELVKGVVVGGNLG